MLFTLNHSRDAGQQDASSNVGNRIVGGKTQYEDDCSLNHRCAYIEKPINPSEVVSSLRAGLSNQWGRSRERAFSTSLIWKVISK